MSSSKKHSCTFDDYCNLPEGVRSDLIDGQLYIGKTPFSIHANLVGSLLLPIGNYLRRCHPECEMILGPLAVNPDSQKINWVEPDLFVTCDCSKIKEQYFIGAPDWVIEVTSFDSRFMDYILKSAVYYNAGVREYWIVDPAKERTTVYHFEEDAAPTIFSFDQDIPVGIFPGLKINIAVLLS